MLTRSGLSFTTSSGDLSGPSVVAQPKLTLPHWSSLVFHLRWAYAGEVPAGYQDRQVDHSATYLAWLVLEGGVEVETARRCYQVSPGSWFVAPRTAFRQKIASVTRLLSINVFCQWPSGRNLFAQDEAALFPASRHVVLERHGRRLAALADRHMPESGAALEFHPMPHHVFLLLQRQTLAWMDSFIAVMLAQGWSYDHGGVTDPRLVTLLSILDRGPLDAESLWNEVRTRTGLDRASAPRLFEAEFGTTLSAYWNRCRLRHVQSVLAAETMPMKELSHLMGFTHQGHFTRWFKERTGVSPQEYRVHATGHGRGAGAAPPGSF